MLQVGVGASLCLAPLRWLNLPLLTRFLSFVKNQRIALLVYLSITFWVNLIANVVINGAIAVGVYCCTDNSVPLVGTTLCTA